MWLRDCGGVRKAGGSIRSTPPPCAGRCTMGNARFRIRWSADGATARTLRRKELRAPVVRMPVVCNRAAAQLRIAPQLRGASCGRKRNWGESCAAAQVDENRKSCALGCPRKGGPLLATRQKRNSATSALGGSEARKLLAAKDLRKGKGWKLRSVKTAKLRGGLALKAFPFRAPRAPKAQQRNFCCAHRSCHKLPENKCLRQKLRG